MLHTANDQPTNYSALLLTKLNYASCGDFLVFLRGRGKACAIARKVGGSGQSPPVSPWIINSQYIFPGFVRFTPEQERDFCSLGNVGIFGISRRQEFLSRLVDSSRGGALLSEARRPLPLPIFQLGWPSCQSTLRTYAGVFLLDCLKICIPHWRAG